MPSTKTPSHPQTANEERLCEQILQMYLAIKEAYGKSYDEVDEVEIARAEPSLCLVTSKIDSDLKKAKAAVNELEQIEADASTLISSSKKSTTERHTTIEAHAKKAGELENLVTSYITKIWSSIERPCLDPTPPTFSSAQEITWDPSDTITSLIEKIEKNTPERCREATKKQLDQIKADSQVEITSNEARKAIINALRDINAALLQITSTFFEEADAAYKYISELQTIIHLIIYPNEDTPFIIQVFSNLKQYQRVTTC